MSEDKESADANTPTWEKDRGHWTRPREVYGDARADRHGSARGERAHRRSRAAIAPFACGCDQESSPVPLKAHNNMVVPGPLTPSYFSYKDPQRLALCDCDVVSVTEGHDYCAPKCEPPHNNANQVWNGSNNTSSSGKVECRGADPPPLAGLCNLQRRDKEL